MSKKSDTRKKKQHAESQGAEHPRPVPKKEEAAPVELSGFVHKFRHRRSHPTDGFILTDGTVIRFPSDAGKLVESRIAPGDQILVIGTYHQTSKGDWQVRASYLECLRSEFTIDINVEWPVAAESHPVKQTMASSPRSCHDILEEIKSVCTLFQARISAGETEDSSTNNQLLRTLRKLRNAFETK